MESNGVFDAEKIKEELFKRYPFGYIPRPEIGKATGGILHPRTMANRDSSKKKGPVKSVEGAVKIGGKICYPVEKVIEFIESETHKFNEAG